MLSQHLGNLVQEQGSITLNTGWMKEGKVQPLIRLLTHMDKYLHLACLTAIADCSEILWLALILKFHINQIIHNILPLAVLYHSGFTNIWNTTFDFAEDPALITS